MMSYDFRWIDWNISKVERHGLSVNDVEYVVNNARRPYPKPIGNEKWLVIGPTASGLVIQVLYIVDADDTLFVIHARPLTPTSAADAGDDDESKKTVSTVASRQVRPDDARAA